MNREVSKIKYNTQNEKNKSITKKKWIVGIDVGSENHFARAFDWCNYEHSKKSGIQQYRSWFCYFQSIDGGYCRETGERSCDSRNDLCGDSESFQPQTSNSRRNHKDQKSYCKMV